jgi:hypothetical protein
MHTTQPILLHSLLLRRAIHLRNPRNSLVREQLGAWLRLNQRVTIQNPRLYNLQPSKGLSITIKRSAAITAEIARDFVAAICRLGDGFWCSRANFEAVFGNGEVGGVCRTCDFAAIKAMAKRLICDLGLVSVL